MSLVARNRKLALPLRYGLVLAPLGLAVYERATQTGSSRFLQERLGMPSAPFIAVLLEYVLLLLVVSLPLISFLAGIPALQRPSSRPRELHLASWLSRERMTIVLVAWLVAFNGPGLYFLIRGLAASDFVTVTGFIDRRDAFDIASKLGDDIVYTYTPLHRAPDLREEPELVVVTPRAWLEYASPGREDRSHRNLSVTRQSGSRYEVRVSGWKSAPGAYERAEIAKQRPLPGAYLLLDTTLDPDDQGTRATRDDPEPLAQDDGATPDHREEESASEDHDGRKADQEMALGGFGIKAPPRVAPRARSRSGQRSSRQGACA